jgi:hypothetical protein
MTFYDYDLNFRRDGEAVYTLRAYGKPLPNGGYCMVRQASDTQWVRKTNWLAKWGDGGIRYEYYRSLDDALLAGVKWARRREAEDKRENA